MRGRALTRVCSLCEVRQNVKPSVTGFVLCPRNRYTDVKKLLCQIIPLSEKRKLLAPNGLGWLVSYNYENFAVAQMYAVMLLIVVFTVVLTSVIGIVQRRLQRLG